jgi:predicted glycosyltransferase
VNRRRVFVYVQHLLGIGHLRRAATLANALARSGVEVTLASGGFPVSDLQLEGVKFVQLPPAAAADLTFKSLVDAAKKPVDDEWKSHRREALLDAWRTAEPQLVVVELFPFGRRQMRFELVPLLDAALESPHRPAIVCSVRDILGGGQSNPARQDEMLETFERYFDRVLVHGDPNVISFGRTFRHAAALGDRLCYTGYIVEERAPPAGEAATGAGEGEVLVSAGGGAVGMRLLETAIRARPFCPCANTTWRILCGVNAPAADLDRLAAIAGAVAPGAIVVERARKDFQMLLANCAVSISQGGYNTMMDSLRAGSRSVVVPFAGGGEVEQTIRARAFAERGLVEMLAEEDLTPQSLAAAVGRAMERPRPSGAEVDLKGAKRAAELLNAWVAEVKW